jgi:thiamine-monophosphate kinase
MENVFTPIATIGEFGLIERLKKIVDFPVDDVTIRNNLRRGISDDTASYLPTPGKIQLLTTDILAEGVHFDLTYTSMRHLGWKTMVASLSDIAAMGGTPRYATIGISIPNKLSLEMIDELYEGIASACKKYSCLIVGGDTTTSLTNMWLVATIIGEADESRVLYRSGARPGDYLCVTGHLGASLAGLKVLQREKKRFTESGQKPTFKPEFEDYALALEKHLMPKPRFDISRLLAEEVRTHALIDISDGLASELHHICRESNVGASLYEHSLPVDSITQRVAGEFFESPTDYALYSGDEYELLFTIGNEEYQKLEHFTNDISIIGKILKPEEGIHIVRENGQAEPLTTGGWNHFNISH